MKKRALSQSAFTLVEIMIVVAIIGLLASIALPNYVKARTNSQANACINNLRQIDGAKQQWALEAKQDPSATPEFSEIQGYMRNTPYCPAGGDDLTFENNYDIKSISVVPTCLKAPAEHKLPDNFLN